MLTNWILLQSRNKKSIVHLNMVYIKYNFTKQLVNQHNTLWFVSLNKDLSSEVSPLCAICAQADDYNHHWAFAAQWK